MAGIHRCLSLGLGVDHESNSRAGCKYGALSAHNISSAVRDSTVGTGAIRISSVYWEGEELMVKVPIKARISVIGGSAVCARLNLETRYGGGGFIP